MNLDKASFNALRSFDRSPGSIQRHRETRPLSPAEQETWTQELRDGLASSQLSCGLDQHQLIQPPTCREVVSGPFVNFVSERSKSTETWTNPEKNAFVQVENHTSTHERSGEVLRESLTKAQYGVETHGYVAGMKIVSTDGQQTRVTAVKIDKQDPQQSWIQEWNLR